MYVTGLGLTDTGIVDTNGIWYMMTAQYNVIFCTILCDKFLIIINLYVTRSAKINHVMISAQKSHFSTFLSRNVLTL